MTYPIDPASPEYAQYVGFATEENPVADANNYYLSSEGVTYRWFKGARFWDEVIVSTQDPGACDPSTPVGGEGAGYPPAPGPQGPQGPQEPLPPAPPAPIVPPAPPEPPTPIVVTEPKPSKRSRRSTSFQSAE